MAIRLRYVDNDGNMIPSRKIICGRYLIQNSIRCFLLGSFLLALAEGMFVTDAWAIKTASSEDVHSLETAMAQWTAALREQNTESFLRFFSRTRPWRYVGTATRRPKATAVTYQRLEHDLRSKEGWYEVLFDADGEDCFRDHVIADGGKLWQRRGLTFVPPGSEYPSPVYVLWRKEKGHWVIEAIAEPSS